MLGYREEEIIGEPIDRVFTREDNEKGEPERERETAQDHGSAQDQRWHVRKDGSRFFANGILTAIRDDAGQLRGFAKVMRDVTAELEGQQQLQKSVKEKDVLLREIHHRVKNNLQVIISLIELQSDYLRDPNARQALQDMHNRVRSIAAIHELLFTTSDVSRIDFANYLQRLSKDLFNFYHARPDQVRLRTDIG